MRRNLLNEILKKYLLIGNVGELLELDIEELKQISSANNLGEARKIFENIIDSRKNTDENALVKKNVLSPAHYMGR